MCCAQSNHLHVLEAKNLSSGLQILAFIVYVHVCVNNIYTKCIHEAFMFQLYNLILTI